LYAESAEDIAPGELARASPAALDVERPLSLAIVETREAAN
jgi:hypothetical protein